MTGWCLVGWFGAALGLWPPSASAFTPPMYIDMPCSTFECPPGYYHRWNAETVLCAEGACSQNDTETCCVHGHFFSHSWRVLAASAVSADWEVRQVRFFQDENCSGESEADTIPGVHHKWRGWPSGAAFSHHHGHGGVAARIFFADPRPTARRPAPVREVWTSGGPCAAATCFVGFRWESDVDRYPLGSCRASFGRPCWSAALVKRADHLRIACAQVEQGIDMGRFADTLRLQFRQFGLATNITDGSLVDEADGTAVWHTVAEARGLGGGLALVRMAKY